MDRIFERLDLFISHFAMTRIRVLKIIATAGFALLVLGLPLSMLPGARYRTQVKFNADIWRTYHPGDPQFADRQQMIRDLVSNVLPNLSEPEIIAMLGPSLTKQAMARVTVTNTTSGNLISPGKGYYFDDIGWDILYPIGQERILIFDHTGQAFSPDEEYLLIRLDRDRRFKDYSIVGSDQWKTVLAKKAGR
jgi:hypothetical protein